MNKKKLLWCLTEISFLIMLLVLFIGSVETKGEGVLTREVNYFQLYISMMILVFYLLFRCFDIISNVVIKEG